jgi:hypothetical protein
VLDVCDFFITWLFFITYVYKTVPEEANFVLGFIFLKIYQLIPTTIMDN